MSLVRVPPEWARHAATWLQWPHLTGDSGYEARFVPTFCEIVSELQHREQVHLIVTDDEAKNSAEDALTANGVPEDNRHFHVISTNNCWCRDNGPMFVASDGKLAVVDWGFNGWGDKPKNYKKYEDDDQVPTEVAGRLGLQCFDRSKTIIEGGALEFNGEGTVIASWSCLERHNPGLSEAKREITKQLKSALGLHTVIWVSEGDPPSDDECGEGHTDGICRFISSNEVVVGRITDEFDPDWPIYEDVYRTLDAIEGLSVSRMDIPCCPLHGNEKHNYLNWYVANGVVLVGTFGCPQFDQEALATIQGYWPDREVRGINIRKLWNEGYGGIHCVTQHQPDIASLQI